MMNVENTENNNEIFDQSATRLKGIKNIMTPSGDVMRVTDTDIKWFNHFYTFKVQGKKCYQSIGTIAKVMGRARSVAQERINNLESLGLLTVGKEAFNEGWRNTYTCTPIDDIVSCMTDAKVTPQNKKLKKSQLDSLLRKAEAVDALAINQGIKEMAKAIANCDLSDEEAIQFAFQIAAEKLAALGWKIETTAKEKGKSDEEATEPQAEQSATAATSSTDAPTGESADQNPGMASESAPDDSGQCDSLESDNDGSSDDRANGNNEVKPEIFDDRGVITEAFINSLAGDVAPNRNADGTLQSFRYVYWVARHTQDALDGISTRTKDEYMAEAQPWHIPPHLLSTPTPEPEYNEDPEF
ncbi:TPA: hypothetical protein JD053_16200 [Klebsiella michiganensis]|uniref:hypothetical protein n=1 Tax=Enterobacteriaceae TaxID=543 RepID=UPI0007DAD5B5|nr:MULTISPECIES: hypothetical protein [Enterobacteriaceae]DAI92727.1 MAG TPA: hypothetical protein [Caudoviricetes sp.]HDR2474980.1 hypothetical protein [Enterobacter soli]EKV5140114.1 hypothetical protein [Klebsiella michiganensis]EMB3265765.1 hypothetical protein [Klebsiella michiganensis]MBA4425316.1 hypothetical protein [Klebsiella michiganensis]